MNRLLVIVVSAVLAGGSAFAQAITVRSGEHEGFSRLVMRLPGDAAWSMDQTRRSVSLTIEAPSVEFDYSTVFDRIPRTRISGVSQNGPGSDLVLSLACGCLVSSFVEAPGFLVIDIRDRAPSPGPAPKKPVKPIAQTAYRLPVPALLPTAASSPPLPRGPLLPVVIGQVQRSVPAIPEVAVTLKPRGSINLSQERLLAQINRASEQGLLELRPDMRPDGATPPPSAAPEATQPQPFSVSISATTAIDRDLAQVARSMDFRETEPACLGSKEVALSDWGGSQQFSTEIGHLRSQLFGEFDRLRPESPENLARAYLYFGFGAEAEQALALDPKSGERYRVLRAMARILDTGDPGDDNPFSGQQDCGGDVALWALMSADSVADDVDRNAVLRALSRLPPHLRNYLGPQVSRKFAEVGDGEMADFILRTIARAGEEPGSGVELAKAAAAELRGDAETQVQALENTVNAGSEYAPEALVKLIMKKFEERGSVSPDLPDLTAAYALELRKAEIGADLRRARTVALALDGRFSEAFDSLVDIEKRDGSTERQSALAPLLALLSERADDVTFLRFALGFAPESGEEIPVQAGNQTARRVLDLGFVEQAAAWVAGSGDPPVSANRRLLRAEIALARQRPNRALVELLGLEGAEAEKLRAQASWQMGDYQRAGQILVKTQDFDRAARGFWLAEEWEAVPEQADAIYSRIAAGSARLRRDEVEPEQLAPLAEARSLMQNSLGTRAEIAELLQTVSVEPGLSQ